MERVNSKKGKRGRTYPCQLPPASTLRRFEERWRGWPCPRGVQELLREYPRVRGGGGSLHLRLRHPGHLHPRDSSTPSTWTQIRTHVMIATAAWRRPLPRPDPGKKKEPPSRVENLNFFSPQILYRVHPPRTNIFSEKKIFFKKLKNTTLHIYIYILEEKIFNWESIYIFINRWLRVFISIAYHISFSSFPTHNSSIELARELIYFQLGQSYISYCTPEG